MMALVGTNNQSRPGQVLACFAIASPYLIELLEDTVPRITLNIKINFCVTYFPD